MKIRTLFNMLVAVCLIGASSAAGFGGGSLWQKARDTKGTKELAIKYNCAVYNGTTGEFEWIDFNAHAKAIAQKATTHGRELKIIGVGQ